MLEAGFRHGTKFCPILGQCVLSMCLPEKYYLLHLYCCLMAGSWAIVDQCMERWVWTHCCTVRLKELGPSFLLASFLRLKTITHLICPNILELLLLKTNKKIKNPKTDCVKKILCQESFFDFAASFAYPSVVFLMRCHICALLCGIKAVMVRLTQWLSWLIVSL